MNRAIITGAAGFVGSHVLDAMMGAGWHVTAVDNFDSFYPKEIKQRNIARYLASDRFRLLPVNICDLTSLQQELREDYDAIIHLAAKAGVRQSLTDPTGYFETNVKGTQNLLELARQRNIEQFVFASSSSVYGNSPRTPWREDEPVLRPLSPYASTKVSGELIGHVYSHLYSIRFIALRLFTVFGPRQRPDLAIHKFAKLLSTGQAIPIYGDGETRRDYTYIDDIVRGIMSAVHYSATHYEAFNLGNSHPVALKDLIGHLADALGVKLSLIRMPEQPGDVTETWACIDKAKRGLDFSPRVELTDGLMRFAAWFRSQRSVGAGA